MPAPVAAVGIAVIWAGLRTLAINVVRWVVANSPAIVTNVLVGLGFYFIVAKPATGLALNFVVDSFSGAPANVVSVLYYVNADDYVQLIVSAYAAVRTYKAGSVALKKQGGNQ